MSPEQARGDSREIDSAQRRLRARRPPLRDADGPPSRRHADGLARVRAARDLRGAAEAAEPELHRRLPARSRHPDDRGQGAREGSRPPLRQRRRPGRGRPAVPLRPADPRAPAEHGVPAAQARRPPPLRVVDGARRPRPPRSAWRSCWRSRTAKIRRARDRAEQEAARATAINQFLQKTFGAADPWQRGSRGVSLVDALKQAEGQVHGAFAAPAGGRGRRARDDREDVRAGSASTPTPRGSCAPR